MHMKRVMDCMEKGSRIVNLTNLVKQNMTERDVKTLNNSVKHLFQFPAAYNKKHRDETMSWESYFNLLCEQKWRLYGEKEGQEQEQSMRMNNLEQQNEELEDENKG